MNTVDKQQLEALYGPGAQFSDHKAGERVKFRDGAGQEQEDEIMFVCAPVAAAPGRRAKPLTYIMREADPSTGLPRMLYQSEILELK
jgi:hypothetical protein